MKIIYTLISGKNTLNTCIIFAVAYSFILLIAFFSITMPLISNIEFMNNSTLNKNNELKDLNDSLSKRTLLLENNKNILNTKMGLFLNDQEIEEFYAEISDLSLIKKMTMKSLVRGETVLIDNENNNSNLKQYKVSVAYELEGSFVNYLSIRKDLANLEKIIVFENESIRRSENNNIIAIGNISVPRMELKGD